MMSKVLTPEQIEQFITRGWTKIPEAFPRSQALQAQNFLWDKLSDATNFSSDPLQRGILKNDRSTWNLPMAFIAQNYNAAPFDGCATAKLDDACSDIVGDGRWINQHKIGWWGWWPINFAVGADQVWDVPADQWHIDAPDSGTHITAPDQGSLVLCLFSELEPRGGGTLIVEGSHQIVTRFLRDNPGLTQNQVNEALRSAHPYLRALTGQDDTAAPVIAGSRGADARLKRPQTFEKTARIRRFMDEIHKDELGTELRVVEVTGSPGDVILAHPFMLHSPSFNHAGVPRFMCNRKTPMIEPMQLDREDGNYSPLEDSIRHALRETANL